MENLKNDVNKVVHTISFGKTQVSITYHDIEAFKKEVIALPTKGYSHRIVTNLNLSTIDKSMVEDCGVFIATHNKNVIGKADSKSRSKGNKA